MRPYMRILLDCRRLSSDPPEGEKRLFILSCAAILAAKRGVEWLFLVDKDDPDVLRGPGVVGYSDDMRYPAVMRSEIGLSLPVSGMIPGAPGRWLWVNWRLPRIVKKWGPGLVMTAE